MRWSICSQLPAFESPHCSATSNADRFMPAASRFGWRAGAEPAKLLRASQLASRRNCNTGGVRHTSSVSESSWACCSARGLGSPRTLRGQATRSPNGRQTWLKGYVVRWSAIRSRVSRDRRSRVGIASASNTTPNERVRILADDSALVRSKACSSQMSDLKLKEYRMPSGAVGGMKGDRDEGRRGKPFYRPPRLHSKAG